MRPVRLAARLVTAIPLLAACGGSDAGSAGSGGSGAATTSGTTTGATGSTGSTGSTTSATSSDGCERGLVRCGDACVDLQADTSHCGACGVACAQDDICTNRVCKVRGTYCADAGGLGAVCGGLCVLTDQSLDHCGGCGVACDATSYCSEDRGCTPWQGDGSSCASPIVLAETGNFSVEFWFPANAALATASCGALGPRPSVTFRWTAEDDDDGFRFEVLGAPTEDLVLEVFSAAPCGPATSLGCNDDESGTKHTPELEVPVAAGKTYFIVVTSKAETAPAGRFTLHLDD